MILTLLMLSTILFTYALVSGVDNYILYFLASISLMLFIIYSFSVIKLFLKKKIIKGFMRIFILVVCSFLFGSIDVIVVSANIVEQELINPSYTLVSEDDYIKEFTSRTGIEITKEYNFIAKTDTIYSDLFGDYTMRCVLKLNKTDKNIVINQLKEDSRFVVKKEAMELATFAEKDGNLPEFSQLADFYVYDPGSDIIVTVGALKNDDIIAFEVFSY